MKKLPLLVSLFSILLSFGHLKAEKQAPEDSVTVTWNICSGAAIGYTIPQPYPGTVVSSVWEIDKGSGWETLTSDGDHAITGDDLNFGDVPQTLNGAKYRRAFNYQCAIDVYSEVAQLNVFCEQGICTDQCIDVTSPTDPTTNPTSPTDPTTNPTSPTDPTTNPTSPTDPTTNPTSPTTTPTDPTSVTSVGDILRGTLNIYPNPTTGVINIDYTGGAYHVSVLDINGNVVLGDAEGVSTIDIGSSSPGLYYVKVSTEEGTSTIPVIRQ